MLRNLAKALTGLAALAFLLAVASVFIGAIMNIQPEGFSRAATNLALLAIALVLVFDESAAPVRGSM